MANASETKCYGNIAYAVVSLKHGSKYYAIVLSTSTTGIVKIRVTLEAT